MTDAFIQVPIASSIQTGNKRVVYLGPIHEGAGHNIEPNQVFVGDPGDEPSHVTDCPVEAFTPPPLVPDYDFVEQSLKQGVKFDPATNISSMKQKTPYHIIDLFWLINPKYGRKEIPREESDFCQISFNIDFNNLKITLYKIPNGSLQGHVLFLNSLHRLASGTIYPSSVFNLIYSSEKFEKFEESQKKVDEDQRLGIEPPKFTCLEQLIVNTGEEWQQNRPLCHFTIGTKITINVRDPLSGTWYYEFVNWQKEALLHAAKFVVDKGYLLTGNQNINSG